MTVNKLNCNGDWNFDDNLNIYSASKETEMEGLSVHLSNERYFEGYAQ
jgi:hypothetical protein